MSNQRFASVWDAIEDTPRRSKKHEAALRPDDGAQEPSLIWCAARSTCLALMRW